MPLSFDASRVLAPDAPRRKYVRSSENQGAGHIGLDAPKSLHFGQRKLLLSEIELLAACAMQLEAVRSATRVIIVYAGAANGSHLPLLFDMFADAKWKFVLIDPAPFCRAVQDIFARASAAGPILEIVNGYCTGELCDRIRQQYAAPGTEFIVISDIRSGCPPKLSNREATEMILRDNRLQQDFNDALRPVVAMLKFHPPYPRCKDATSPHFDATDDTPDEIEYYDGHAVLGVWPPKSSSEVRLVVESPGNPSVVKMRKYDCTAFEEACYFYNTENRYAKDVAAELRILTQYLEYAGRAAPEMHEIIALSARVSEFLGFPKFIPVEGHFFAAHAAAEGAEADDLSIIVGRHVVNRFSEDDARLCALLYDADAIQHFTPD